MYCIDTEALVFMFDGGSPYGFTTHGLDGLKVPLPVYTNHINNKKHVHHGFLAPRPYLCSTSLIIFDEQHLPSIIFELIFYPYLVMKSSKSKAGNTELG